MSLVRRALTRLALALVPRAARARYVEELAAEVAELPAGRRTAYVLSFLRGTPALRRALAGAVATAPRPLLCRLHLHHNRLVHPNSEDQRIIALECTRCGHLRDPRQYLPRDNNTEVAWAAARAQF